ncbi:tetratricopeptide repeat protein [Chamaesiphon sp. OTE_8_metabat_110]|uniref:tetratricopeptide repeat protein n=1 Tax=Chamaesiphon sp. OTE_8_metabat_110 TaxID=2964696 RepID=UPI00286C9C63|nr:tetratricopeptide repeat protein [Chamaesiphon sp. OTE_8_metabat_110]
MSKPSSSSTTPEFATQNDYSDILGTAMPSPPAAVDSAKLSAPAQPQAAKTRSPLFRDPWSDSGELEVPQAQPLQIEAEDPWASDTSPTPQRFQAPARQPVAAKVNSSVGATQQPKQPTQPTQPTQPKQPIQSKQPTPTLETPAKAAQIDTSAPSVTGKDLALKYCDRAKKALAAKDYAQARSAYKIAIEWDPTLAIAHSGAAEICYEIQDYEGALSAWDLAIKCDPTQLDFYYQRALVHKIFKNYYQVLADCRYVLERDPERSSVRWLNAVALVKIENYQVALASLDRHVKDFPRDPNGYCYRGICYERLDLLPQALVDLDKAIAIQSGQPVFHHARGRTRQKLGDFAGALADFDITIDRKPQATVYDDRAETHRCLGNCTAALADDDRAIELNPKFINAYFRRGLIYTELGNLDDALTNYSMAIDLDSEHTNALIQRSWTYFRKHEYQRTKRDCQSVKAIDKFCFWANYLIGVVDSLSGLHHSAIKNFSRAIELSPNYVSARYHRGIVYHELGERAKAMADFEHARSIQDRGLERLVDRDETGFYAEGLALYQMGQSEAARTVLILGALSAKRFNNPRFHQLLQSKIEELGMASGEMMSESNSCDLSGQYS